MNAVQTRSVCRTLDDPCSIHDARDGLCQRGDVIVEGHSKGLFVGMSGPVPWVFWDSVCTTNERFLVLCETLDHRGQRLKLYSRDRKSKSKRQPFQRPPSALCVKTA